MGVTTERNPKSAVPPPQPPLFPTSSSRVCYQPSQGLAPLVQPSTPRFYQFPVFSSFHFYQFPSVAQGEGSEIGGRARFRPESASSRTKKR